jgi:hypothetical protein
LENPEGNPKPRGNRFKETNYNNCNKSFENYLAWKLSFKNKCKIILEISFN